MRGSPRDGQCSSAVAASQLNQQQREMLAVIDSAYAPAHSPTRRAARMSKPHSPTWSAAPGRLKPLTCSAAPGASSPPRKTVAMHLSLAVRQQWMREANETCELAAMNIMLDAAAPAYNEPTQLQSQLASINHPAATLDGELAMQPVAAHAAAPTSTSVTPIVGRLSPLRAAKPSALRLHKRAAAASTIYTDQPLYAHCQPHGAAVHHRAVRAPSRVAIAPLVSTEMYTKLRTHVAEKLAGDLWQSEVRSRLARPLSATTFCARAEQLRHPLTAPAFAVAPSSSSSPGAAAAGSTVSPTSNADAAALQLLPTLFPYSVEAHACARQIGDCYNAMRFRFAVLVHARCLAVALRRLRRRFVPHWRRWHYTRVAAAVCIQRCVRHVARRLAQWQRTVLRPCAVVVVQHWLDAGLRVACAKYVVVRWLEHRFVVRQQQQREAHKQRRVLRRWVAKTRVCLFVHVIWCAAWLRGRRERNLAALVLETQAMVVIDAQARSDFHVFSKTSMGVKMLKTELVAWRQRVQHTSSSSSNSSVCGNDGSNSSDASGDANGVDPSVVRLRSCFRAFDLDSSGALDLDEFQLLLSYLRDGGSGSKNKRNRLQGRSTSSSTHAAGQTQMHTKLTLAQTRALFDELDSDDSGHVTCAELETWWQQQQQKHNAAAVNASRASGSASSTFLSTGLNKLVLESHGLLFWLLGRRQQLERAFVKKQLAKRAGDSAMLTFLLAQIQREASPPVRRCAQCGRRFELLRDVREHAQIGCTAAQLVVDTFVRQRWAREEELRLLADADTSDE